MPPLSDSDGGNAKRIVAAIASGKPLHSGRLSATSFQRTRTPAPSSRRRFRSACSRSAGTGGSSAVATGCRHRREKRGDVTGGHPVQSHRQLEDAGGCGAASSPAAPVCLARCSARIGRVKPLRVVVQGRPIVHDVPIEPVRNELARRPVHGQRPEALYRHGEITRREVGDIAGRLAVEWVPEIVVRGMGRWRRSSTAHRVRPGRQWRAASSPSRSCRSARPPSRCGQQTPTAPASPDSRGPSMGLPQRRP